MDHATTKYHIGNHKTSRRKKAKAIAPTTNGIFRIYETPERCFGYKERQAEIRSHQPTTNGFLKTTFLPKLRERKTEKLSEIEAKIRERDFYNSLSQLAEHYQIQTKPTKHFDYPYNIALALDDVEYQLKNKLEDWEEVRLIKTEEKIYLTSKEHYDTGSMLYYIPIIPLYKLSKNPKRKQATELLKSVYSYMYHIAQIPYYRDQNSYLYWMYEMIRDWIVSDDENEDTPTYLSELKQAEIIGKLMTKKIFSNQNLSRFKERLYAFQSKDKFDNDCFLLASKIFELYQNYPYVSIYRNAQIQRNFDQDEEFSSLSMDKYISFCAEVKGWLFQTLFENVNMEFQEYASTEEPTIIKKFDGSDLTNINLDYEKRIFRLIEELIDLLNNS